MLLGGVISPLCKHDGCLGAVYAPLKKRPGVFVVGLNGGSHGDDKNTTIIEGGDGGRIRPCWWCFTRNAASSSSRNRWARIGLVTAAAAAIMFSSVGITNARTQQQPTVQETLSDIPQMLSGECSAASAQDCKKARIQRPKSRKAESCTIKCVTTCIRGGGDGSPGEGPLNLRRPLVVFKQGFRSRRYCLVECSDICNLIGDGDDGP
ncbi:uncharacterized protein LOC131336405 [Rhododendron vialii]|uniref:uncharacterized protein LOC131336405 n=1 Tax=Rhododendron vialii TaxID=182163 RepID=UPI00265F1016|nr:uncharacterized protein LOC131336405 [Rhododendron vialii]